MHNPVLLNMNVCTKKHMCARTLVLPENCYVQEVNAGFCEFRLKGDLTIQNANKPYWSTERGHEHVLARSQNLWECNLALKRRTWRTETHTHTQCARLSPAEVNADLKEHEIGVGTRGKGASANKSLA